MDDNSEDDEVSEKEEQKEPEFVEEELNFDDIDVASGHELPKYEFDDDDDNEDRLSNIINETRAKIAASFNNPESYKDEIFGIEYQDEHLTDTFHETKWKPPSTGNIISVYYATFIFIICKYRSSVNIQIECNLSWWFSKCIFSLHDSKRKCH